MVRVWDSKQERWLQVLSMEFNNEGAINKLTVKPIYEDSDEEPSFIIEGFELENFISITGEIGHNIELLPAFAYL